MNLEYNNKRVHECSNGPHEMRGGLFIADECENVPFIIICQTKRSMVYIMTHWKGCKRHFRFSIATRTSSQIALSSYASLLAHGRDIS